jgi:hypothetical protein
MKPDKFRQLIRRVLTEETEKKGYTNNAIGGSTPTRVPQMNGDGIDPTKKHKTFPTDANSRDNNSKEGLLNDLIKVVDGVEAVGDNVTVIWDDHDDLMINGRDLKFIRISPKWEDYYVIEMMTRNEDRVWVTGLDWDQVKDFVKINLKSLYNQPTAAEKAYDKSYRNREDQSQTPDKGLNQKNKSKHLPLTNEPVKTAKNKDKNYTEDQNKNGDDDLPEKPMKEVKDWKKLIDYKVKDPVKIRKRNPDTKLVVKQF